MTEEGRIRHSHPVCRSQLYMSFAATSEIVGVLVNVNPIDATDTVEGTRQIGSAETPLADAAL
ncbi:hypothetical protein [Paramicrobacterium humi]|nr:hypothetical protein [Microbacterium humi]